ncbi:hypothetical protein [Micromonospora sp. NPDC023737]|uniref:hypothetical protein n=1 Tax=unclassified Micromonospora TaxID=2617518 RepID=UPI0033F58D94
MSDRLTRCRYRRRNDDMCTGEAVDPDGDVLLCQKHLGRAVALVRHAAVQRLARQKPAIRKRT